MKKDKTEVLDFRKKEILKPINEQIDDILYFLDKGEIQKAKISLTSLKTYISGSAARWRPCR